MPCPSLPTRWRTLGSLNWTRQSVPVYWPSRSTNRSPTCNSTSAPASEASRTLGLTSVVAPGEGAGAGAPRLPCGAGGGLVVSPTAGFGPAVGAAAGWVVGGGATAVADPLTSVAHAGCGVGVPAGCGVGVLVGCGVGVGMRATAVAVATASATSCARGTVVGVSAPPGAIWLTTPTAVATATTLVTMVVTLTPCGEQSGVGELVPLTAARGPQPTNASSSTNVPATRRGAKIMARLSVTPNRRETFPLSVSAC